MIGRVLESILATFDVLDRSIVEAAVADYISGPGDFAGYYIGRANEQAGADTTLTFDRKLKADRRFHPIR